MTKSSHRDPDASTNSQERAEREYLRLLEGLPIGIERIDLEGTIVFSNRAHQTMHGYEPGELVGASIFDLLAEPEQAGFLRQHLAHLVRDQPPPEPWLGTDRCKDGTTIDVRVDWDYEYGNDGELTGFIAAITDITEQRRAERERDENLLALEENQRHIASLLENAVEFVLYRIAVEPDDPYSGRVVFVSDSIRDLMGVEDPDDFSSWFARILPEDLPRVAEANRLSAATGQPFDVEMRVQHPERQEVRCLRALSRPVMGEDGRPLFFNGLILDITSMRRAETERQRFELKVQQAQRLESLGVLAGGIAHDFNNLLVGMLGNADLALRTLQDDSPARSFITSVVAAAQRASELTNQLLAYSGGGPLIVRPTDLNELLEELSALLTTVISKKVQLRLDLARPLPLIEADSNQLRQVFMNLITNASDAIGDRDGKITVSSRKVTVDSRFLAERNLLGEIEPGAFLEIEVADDGRGMAPDTVQHIFDPFFSTKSGGRGLGLAAVMGIVRSHRGAVEVSTQMDKGTVFNLFFPLSDIGAIDETRDTDAIVPAAEGDFGGTILVADDEELVRSVAQKMLESGGYEVLTARDGLEAVEVFSRFADEVDTVLLDMSMPRMDGVESLRRIREIRSDVRVVLSSGYDEEQMVGRLASEGIAEFIQKPYRVRELLRLMSAPSRDTPDTPEEQD